jgi:hypothetical protein
VPESTKTFTADDARLIGEEISSGVDRGGPPQYFPSTFCCYLSCATASSSVAKGRLRTSGASERPSAWMLAIRSCPKRNRRFTAV